MDAGLTPNYSSCAKAEDITLCQLWCERPLLAGAAQIGRISIANSDASAYAYVNGAIDAADRAVNEQIADA